MVVGARLALLSRRRLAGPFAAALACCFSVVAFAEGAQPQVILLSPSEPDDEAIIIPVSSPIQLASFPRDQGVDAKFRGRFNLSGAYELVGYGEDSTVTVWPDRKSRDALPYWRVRGGPDELYLSNPWAFAQAVVAKDKLAKLKSGKLESVKGRVTIVADDYETSIECDVANFSARFVSLVNAVQIAALPQSQEGC